MERRQQQWTTAMAMAIFAITALTLQQMGRTLWCSCGSLVPWSWDIWSSHNSQHLIDPYFFSHVLHGVLFYGALSLLPDRVPLRVRFLIAIAIEAGWEIFENTPFTIDRYREATISLDYYGDSIANSMTDIVACALGFWFSATVRWWWSVALLVAVELVMLATIRDSLALNVLMLVYPIDAVKEWQGG